MDALGAGDLRRLAGGEGDELTGRERTGDGRTGDGGAAEKRSPPCVSLYLPTHVSGDQGQQDPVRLKNLVQQAEEQLIERGVRSSDAREWLEPARALPTDPAFWDERSHGLAIFIKGERFERFRLPRRFDELAIVGRRFHVKPLLPLLTGGDRFFLLALSQKKVRLFSASQYAIEQVDLPDLPTDIDTTLDYDEVEPRSQVHSASRPATGGTRASDAAGTGKQAAVFHGQGGKPDSHQSDLLQFFRRIDAALQPALRDESTPLMLAGVEYLLPIFRSVASYPHLAGAELTGNCDYMTAYQIHQRAWPLIEPTVTRPRQAAAEQYRDRVGGPLASADLRRIVPAAQAGRVDTLFVDLQAQQWGRFDPPTERVELHDAPQANDEELLDLAAVLTLLRRGEVYSVERTQLPGGEIAAAVLRY